MEKSLIKIIKMEYSKFSKLDRDRKVIIGEIKMTQVKIIHYTQTQS